MTFSHRSISVARKLIVNLGSKQVNHWNQPAPSYVLSRYMTTSSSASSSNGKEKSPSNNQVSVTFVKYDGTKVTVKASQDKSLYDAVIDNNVDIDGFGACEGTLCCTTCHLIFKQSDYVKVGEPSDEEMDMLDLAYGLTETSRLGCQVMLKKELDPLEVHVPASINDVRAS